MGATVNRFKFELTHLVIALTFVVLWAKCLSEKNMLGLGVSIALFAGAVFALGRSFFWKAAFVTFGLLGVGQLMLVLGGFEPNLAASTLTRRVLSFEFALLFLFLLSAAMSFASGRRAEKRAAAT
jgi:hypothetical protein